MIYVQKLNITCAQKNPGSIKKCYIEDGIEKPVGTCTTQHNFAYMSEEQLLTITRNQSELKQPHKQVNKLERHREKLSEFGDKIDKDLKCMLEKLNAGLCSKRERFKSPICMWKGCSGKRFLNVDPRNSLNLPKTLSSQ